MKKTSMSVREMQLLLGICKTESYWLIKKGYFEVRVIGRGMRIMVESFDEWYSSQFHYKRVDGVLPGTKWGDTLSIPDFGSLLGLSPGGAYWLVDHAKIETVIICNHKRIMRETFEKWYHSQSKYKIIKDCEV